MIKNKISGIELMILIYLVVQLITGIGSFIINERYYEPFQQKLLITGEIVDMNYFNITFSDNVYYSLIINNSDITKHYYNLTIKDILSNSLKYVI